MSASSDHSRLKVTGFGIWSLMLLPNKSLDGDTPMSAGGVLRWRRSALATASVFNDPLGLIFVVKIRFITLTKLSALPLL